MALGDQREVFEKSQHLTTRFTFSIADSLHGRSGDKDIPEANPEEELVHRPGLEEGIVSADGVGNGVEGVHLAGNTDEVLDDEPDDGEHSRPSLADLAFAKPGNERGVGLGEAQGIELELAPPEVDASGVVIPDGVEGCGGLRGDRGRGEGFGTCTEGGEEGGSLHHGGNR